MRRPLRELGRAASTATGWSAGSASSACRSRSGTRSTPTASPTTTQPLARRRGPAADRPVDATPRPATTRRPARRARRLHRRPRRHGHLGHVVADPADRRRLGHDDDLFARVFPMDLRPQAHDIIRTWLFSTRACAATSSTARCRGRTRRSPAGSSTRTARRCRKSKGNVVTPTDAARGVRLRRRALLGGQRPAGHRHRRSTTAQMKVGRRLAIKLLNASQVRARPRRRRGRRRGHRAARPRDARRAGRRGRGGHGRRSRPTTTPARSRSAEAFFWTFCDDYLELVKDRAYGERRRARRVGHARRLRIALSCCMRLFAPFLPVRHRGGLVVVAGGLGAPRRVAHRGRARRG